MGSRMEKYENNVPTSRMSKNRNLYEEIDRIDVGYIDLNDSNVLEIPTRESDRKIKTREDYKRYRDLDGIINIPKEEKHSVLVKEKKERIYDINEILRRAKQELKEEENKNRLLNTEYNILTKLDLAEKEKLEKNELREEELKKIIEDAYPKKEIVDDNKDFFEDLKEETLKEEIFDKDTGDIEVVKSELKKDEEEIQKTIIDTGYDTELIPTEKNGKFGTILIILFVLLLLGAGCYILLNYFEII
ncbi:MAG: hypothetical protein E7172_05105 [Firmicutes bacterium]|nr:hypothetical protein [Bacillota bacterium]